MGREKLRRYVTDIACRLRSTYNNVKVHPLPSGKWTSPIPKSLSIMSHCYMTFLRDAPNEIHTSR